MPDHTHVLSGTRGISAFLTVDEIPVKSFVTLGTAAEFLPPT